MKTIKVLFFGQLTDYWNPSKFSITTQFETVEDLYQELLKSAKEEPFKKNIKVAINEEFADWNSTINDQDTIAFLPPASGG